uniref:protein spotted leaf 11-like n=1 Tax=Erigeron canadensis TaxID=72917 RepID=UPI001CB93C9D|nr:protein spotted leaf 11-like [Erigeron canadensis]
MLTIFKLIKDFMIGCRDDANQQQQLKGIEDFIDSDNISITPNEFICPISLQLMKRPVIISSGRTYDKSSIETWMLTGNTTCPVTGQILTNMRMIPNYALQSLITDWCQKNRILPPDGDITIPNPPLTDVEYVMIDAYIDQLNSHDPMVQQKGAANISLFSRRNEQVRAKFCCVGPIPSLTRLMKSTDPVTQDIVMSAILNLSVCNYIKKLIVSTGATNEIINVMRTGSLEA